MAKLNTVLLLRALAVICSMLLMSKLQAKENWLLLTHSTDGQVIERDGQLHGIAHAGKRAFHVELMLRLQQELHLNGRIRDVPLARGLSMLSSQSHVALFNLNRTSAREDQVHWVGPIWQENDYFYERSAYPSEINSVEDARLLPVCVLNGNVHDQLLSQLGFSQLTRSFSYEGCLQMLVAGRVTLTVSSSFDIAKKLRDAGINPRDIYQLPIVVNRAEGYIGLSLATPPGEVKRWQAALDRLRLNGEYQLLYQQFAK